jgi:type IV pilus assembly protein PilV
MQRSRGFSLIEVMVSVVILSIGLLGTAGLMGASVKSTNTAYYRSQATVLADDYLDRMRANLKAARAGDYDLAIDKDCTAPASTMALYDCTEWKTALTDTLPEGKGAVEVTAGSGDVKILISWGDGADSFTTNSRL